MSKKALRFGNVLLCDHVARGENNKFILVNVYAGDIIVQQLPATLPLGLYCEYLPDQIGPMVLNIKINVNEEMIAEAAVPIDVVEFSPQVIAIGHFLAVINKEGSITVSIASDRYKKAVVLNKEVRAGIILSSISNAPPQPS